MAFSEINNNPIDNLWEKTPDYLHELEEGEIFSLANDSSRFFVRGDFCDYRGNELIECYEFLDNKCPILKPEIFDQDTLVWRQTVKFQDR